MLKLRVVSRILAVALLLGMIILILEAQENSTTEHNLQVAYTREGEIYLADVETGEETRLTNFEATSSTRLGPAKIQWSPDGTQIAFILKPLNNTLLVALDIDTNTMMQIANIQHAPVDQWELQWSPDGTQIMFLSRNRPTEVDRTQIINDNIHIVNTDGSNLRIVTNHEPRDFFPRWSPDGTQIAFVEDTVLSIVDADGTNLHHLIPPNDASDNSLQWSPDGTQIVFVSTREDNLDIFVVNADGTNLQNLTNHEGWDRAPQWSPDGSKIVFLSNRGGNDNVHIMDADGSNVRNLSQHEWDDFAPQWSPDGTQIVFMSAPESTYTFEGNDQTMTLQNNNWEIFVIAADGTNLQRITNTYEDDWFPVWRP